MNVDCRWVASNLEAVLSDQLDPDQKSGFEKHLNTCEYCRGEIEGYAKVDRLVGAHMNQQTARAYEVPHPRISSGRLAAVATAAAAVLAVVLWLPSVANQPATQVPPLAEVSAPDTPSAVVDIDKAPDATASERAKPGVDAAPAQKAQTAPASTADIPESADPRFYVTDAAGYSYSLDDFAGSVLVFAVFGESYAEAARFQEVYDSYAPKSNLRILGVSTVTTAARPSGITFPLMTNRGSSLLDTPAGEFVVVGADGTPHRRGSLNDDGLLETLGSALRELGL